MKCSFENKEKHVGTGISLFVFFSQNPLIQVFPWRIRNVVLGKNNRSCPFYFKPTNIYMYLYK